MRLMKNVKKKEKKKAKKMKRIEEQQQQQLSSLPQDNQQTDSQPDGMKKVKSKQNMTLDISQMVDKLFTTSGVSIIIMYKIIC